MYFELHFWKNCEEEWYCDGNVPMHAHVTVFLYEYNLGTS